MGKSRIAHYLFSSLLDFALVFLHIKRTFVTSPIPHFFLFETPRAEVAQLAEHSPEKAGVDSSILSLGTTYPHLINLSLAPPQVFSFLWLNGSDQN